MARSTGSGQARTALRTRVHAEPFLKWAGGKTQLLSQFEALYPFGSAQDRPFGSAQDRPFGSAQDRPFGSAQDRPFGWAEDKPERVERYVEPFVGSGAVFFDIHRRFPRLRRGAALSDNNAELINCYQVVRDDVETLIELLAQHKKRHHARLPDYYYKVRERAPEELTPAKRAARLIYLNKTCYNGLYRVNARGVFNVPAGRYKNPAICDAELLRAASRALQNVEIKRREFWQWARRARAGDFFYIDPPYFPLSRTASFTAYTEGGFGPDEQRRLGDFVREIDAKGCLVMVSNSDTRFIRDLYRGFRTIRVNARRSINSNGRARGAITELVITNYEPRTTASKA